MLSSMGLPENSMPEGSRGAREPDGARRFIGNDWLGRFEGAKTPGTRRRWIEQVLDELERGGAFMKLDHRPDRG